MSNSIGDVALAFARLSRDQREELLRFAPELFRALERVKEQDVETQRRALRLRVALMRERGEHVPEWMEENTRRRAV